MARPGERVSIAKLTPEEALRPLLAVDAGDVSQSCPTVYMLCGFVGSGKTTYARHLEAQGVARLSIDEFVFEHHGTHGVDYDEREYPAHESEAREALDDLLLALLNDGRDVVLDYGFWSRESRNRYKSLAEAAGAKWSLLYFQTDLAEIRERLRARNESRGANALFVDDRHIDEFLTRWQAPQGEGEQVIAATAR